ncbi:LOW QUALITY PROTEIN: B-cell CLL/lymphoma 6 member B protein [Pituophis catenifer annectens]|uniref:LOW QUALITY PROTEIN: B-cell CLL/lymphoma 6 member B protein n=1 Tax=Pituophis catenifer annectens TaxID=94852 RepID=UPI0039959403
MAGPSPPSYVREFTRHSSDVLTNLNELRKRQILTDVTLRVGGCPLRAHKAVLTACSGFFYSVFLGHGGHEVSMLTLPSSIEPVGFQALLDFMYTSRLLLSPGTAPAVLVAASYLQMEHVVQSCHRFLQASYDRLTFLLPPLDPQTQIFRPLEDEPSLQRSSIAAPFSRGATTEESPQPASFRPPEKESGAVRSPGAGDLFPVVHPASPAESSGCTPIPDPKICNWKKYRFIVLHSTLRQTEVEAGQSGSSGEGSPAPRRPPGDLRCSVCNPAPPTLSSQPPKPLSAQRRDGCSSGSGSSSCQACDLHYLREEDEEERGSPAPGPDANEKPYKCHFCSSAFRCKGSLASHRALHAGEKPYHCGICGAQFNRPANLKTHLRIHSGEKPYKCEMCGSCFVQVAHLRAHVLIHTGEKPYPCGTCGTRFRHLQTLKSHLRIHTGEKPYHCEQCRVHFRHKSQLRLHLRQKHGAVTNTKIRYQVLDGPYATVC